MVSGDPERVTENNFVKKHMPLKEAPKRGLHNRIFKIFPSKED